MNYFKRGRVSLVRRPGKSVILLFLVFILSTVMAGTLLVSQAVENTHINLRRNIRPLVTFEFDWEGFSRTADIETLHGGIRPEIPSDVIRSIGNLPHIEVFDHRYHGTLRSLNIDEYEISHFDPNLSDWSTFSFIGTGNEGLMDVREGVIELVQGRTFTTAEIENGAHMAIIYRGVAQLNGLDVGSMMRLSNAVLIRNENWTPPMADDVFFEEEIELEIIGVFDINRRSLDDLPEFARHQEWNRIQILANRIYAPNELVREVHDIYLENNHLMIESFGLPPWFLDSTNSSSRILLDDSLNLEAFSALAGPLLPDYWQILDLTETHGAITHSMSSLEEIAGMIFWFALGATLTILTLLILLFVRDRRYEIGVYLSLGEKRVKIVVQMLLEIVSVSMIGIFIAIFAGRFIANQLSHYMLETEITQALAPVDWGMAMFVDMNDLMFRFGGMGVENLSLEEMMAAFDVNLNLEGTLLFMGVGLLAVFVSTVIPIIYLTGINPKKVLMEAKN